jgi:hypothetical protein
MRPRHVTGEDGLRIDANVFNTQSPTSNKRFYSSLRVDFRANNTKP